MPQKQDNQAANNASVPWRPDLGDGAYKNPVIYADYSDPDVIRVGDDYWMISSSFSHVPGLPVLHSRDLVNWTLVNHALPALVPHEHFSTVRAGKGVWAPSLRYHAEKYRIYYPDPDFGIYVITANDPRAAWSAPVLVKEGRGLIDPCPLWDDDGSVWLVHGWAMSRAGVNNKITLHRLSADGLGLADEGRIIIDADKLPGWRLLEGPKIYKRDGWYYIFAPAGGVIGGYQSVFRSRAIEGPYENRIVLDQGSTRINGPHQGAWVDTPSGEHWFLHFQKLAALGRVVHLQPMRWDADGWPRMGTAVETGATCGDPVLRFRKPAAYGVNKISEPATSDDFSTPALGLQWQWQANPRDGWAKVDASTRTLRLAAQPMTEAHSHWLTPHLLMQKFPAPDFTATVMLTFAPDNSGAHAGLMVFGCNYAWLGLRRESGALRVVLAVCRDAHQGTAEQSVATLDTSSASVWLRVSVTDATQCSFSCSFDGENYTPLDGHFEAASSIWVGAKVGLFASVPPGAEAGESAMFQQFTITS